MAIFKPTYRMHYLFALVSIVLALAFLGVTPVPAHAASLGVVCEHLTYADHLCEVRLAPDYPTLDSVTIQKLSGGGVMTASSEGMFYSCNLWIGTAQFRATAVYQGTTYIRDFSLACQRPGTVIIP